MPEGYALVLLPETAKFHEDIIGESNITICRDYNVLKILISIGQLLFSVATLYRTRGDQVELFGYAAFGLTVTPYAWMSLVNLLGNFMTPQYSTKFLVGSKTLDDLKIELASCPDTYPIEGEVGRITDETERDIKEGHLHHFRHPSKTRAVCLYIMSFLVAAVPIAIVGGISRFEPAASTAYQRVWIMMWLVFGMVLGPVLYSMDNTSLMGFDDPKKRWFRLAYAITYCAPSIGGFVVVGQMIAEYGVCSEIPG